MLLFLGSVVAYAVGSQLAGISQNITSVVRYIFVGCIALLALLACTLFPSFNGAAASVMQLRISSRHRPKSAALKVIQEEEGIRSANTGKSVSPNSMELISPWAAQLIMGICLFADI